MAFSIRHIGLEIEFHHPQSDTLRLSHEIEDDYSIDKEKAAIFTETASNLTFSTEDMLEWYLSRSQKSLAEHLPDRVGEEDEIRRMAITFPIQFPENTFHMMTDRGAVDIKALRLAIEVTG
ncbi:MAG: hypothetical protein ISR45_03640 [Rhodospirillales bacterium]|nr:hypothetical protein [Rhodospirillales bacterium]